MEENSGNVHGKEISIIHILNILKYSWVYILIVTLLFAVVAAVYTNNFVDKKYSSTVKFYIVSDRINGQLGNELTAAKTLVDSYTVVLKNSDSFLQDVAEEAGVDYSIGKIRSMLNAGSIDNTEAFYVKISDSDPEVAYRIAKAVEKYAPTEIISIVEAGSVKVLNPPKLATAYDNPGLMTTVVIGAALGFFVSALFFIVLNLLDNHIRTEEDLAQFELPILGTVPTIETDSPKKMKFSLPKIKKGEKK